MAQTYTVHDFFKEFPDDDACLAHLMDIRYGDLAECPKCGKLPKFHRVKKRPVFECQWCGQQISPMQGTPFERTHTPLNKWFYAMYLFTTTRNGVSAKELQRQLGVTYKTAWRMGHEIRKYMAKIDGEPPLDTHVEIDETYLGGVRKGVKGTYGKTVVFGILEREGEVFTKVVPNTRAKTLIPEIVRAVPPLTRISTDTLATYKQLPEHGFIHASVNHDAEEWVRGDVHVNGIEGFWSMLKRSISGTHVHVSRKHLPNYLGEFEYRYNMRKRPRLMFRRLLMSF